MIKHYVEFLSPGTFCSESDSRLIDSWDIKKSIELSKGITQRYGAKPYGFKFSTYKDVGGISVNGENFKTEPKLLKKSGIYYLTGTVRSAQEVLSGTDLAEDILRDNVRINKFNAIIENRNSYLSTFPFYENDLVVDWDGNIIDEGKKYIV